MLPVVGGRLNEVRPDEIDERNSLILRFRPVLGIMLKYIAHLGQLTKVHPREQAPDEQIKG